MKKKEYLIIVLIVGIILGGVLSTFLNSSSAMIDITAKKINNCKKNPILYMRLPDYNIYSVCLGNIKIEGKELKSYLAKDPTYTEQLTKTLDIYLSTDKSKTEMYDDGGSKLYKTNQINILKCHTIEGNKDIYLGPVDMKYENNFCKYKKVKEKQFTRTYQILHIAESNDEQYIYLTIRQFQSEEVETVKVEKKLTPGLIENKFYEFTFSRTDIYPKDQIKDIFNQWSLDKITETKKSGLEQIQDSIA